MLWFHGKVEFSKRSFVHKRAHMTAEYIIHQMTEGLLKVSLMFRTQAIVTFQGLRVCACRNGQFFS